MALPRAEREIPIFDDVYRRIRNIPDPHRVAFRLADQFTQLHHDKVSLLTSEGEMRRRLDELSFIPKLFAQGFREFRGNPMDLVRSYKETIAEQLGNSPQPVALDLLDVDGMGFAVHDIESPFRRLYSILASVSLDGERAKQIFIGFQDTYVAGITETHQHVGKEEKNEDEFAVGERIHTVDHRSMPKTEPGGGLELYLPVNVNHKIVIRINRKVYELTRNFEEIIAVLPGDRHSVEFGPGGGTMLLVGGSGFGPKDYNGTHKAGFKTIERRNPFARTVLGY